MGVESPKSGAIVFAWRELRPKIALVVVLYVGTKVVSVIRKLRKAAQRKKQLPFPGIPYVVPNPHWLLGHLGAVGGSNVMEGQKRLCYSYAGPNGVCSYWHMHIPTISFLRAEDARKILRFNAERMKVPGVSKHLVRFLGRSSLIMTTGKEWKANRNIVHRAFLNESMEDAQDSIVQASHRFEKAIIGEILQNAGSLTMDIVDLTKMGTLDIFGLAALGYDFGCTANNRLALSDVIKTFEFLVHECNRRCFSYISHLNPCEQHYWIPTPRNLTNKRETKKIRDLLIGIVSDRRSKIEVTSQSRKSGGRNAESRKRMSMLDHLLGVSANSLEKVELTDEFLSDFLVSILFGGFETTSLALSNTLYMLALHPKVEQECVREARSILGPYPSIPPDGFNVLKELPYCCAALFEAMRLLPPIPMTVRNLNRPMDIEVNGKTIQIPAKTRVFLSITWIHRYEENFARAHEFLPERWVEQKPDGTWTERVYNPQEAEANDGDYIPAANRKHVFTFSAGARSCVGEPFAMRQAPTALAFFLRSLKAELVNPNYRIQLRRTGPTQVPEGGIPMVIREREK